MLTLVANGFLVLAFSRRVSISSLGLSVRGGGYAEGRVTSEAFDLGASCQADRLWLGALPNFREARHTVFRLAGLGVT